VENGHLPIVEFLWNRGHGQRNMIEIAILSCHTQVAKFLFVHDPTTNINQYVFNILFTKGSSSMIKLLLNRGLNLNNVDPLISGLKSGHEDSVRLFLDRLDRPNFYAIRNALLRQDSRIVPEFLERYKTVF
jgi:hypothetical protein